MKWLQNLHESDNASAKTTWGRQRSPAQQRKQRNKFLAQTPHAGSILGYLDSFLNTEQKTLHTESDMKILVYILHSKTANESDLSFLQNHNHHVRCKWGSNQTTRPIIASTCLTSPTVGGPCCSQKFKPWWETG